MTTLATSRPVPAAPVAVGRRYPRLPATLVHAVAAVVRFAARAADRAASTQLGSDTETAVSRWTGARV